MIDYAKHQIVSKQENKIYTLDFDKDNPVIGEVIYPQQLRLMLLRNSELKQATFNVAYHMKNGQMQAVDMNFIKSKSEEIKTPMGNIEIEVFEANYRFENQTYKVIFWYAKNKEQLLVKSEIWVDGKLTLRSIINDYEKLQSCIIEN